MKKIQLKATFLWCAILAGGVGFSSCVHNLLNQTPTTEVSKDVFWKTVDDATYAINGAYASIRPYFSYEHFFDAMTEIGWSRGAGTATVINSSFTPTASGFGNLWKGLYGGVNRANYVINGVENMLPNAKANQVAGLERVMGEARFLRALCYFRLITMWGDVPYFDFFVQDKSAVERLYRTPIAEIKNYILEDLDYAVRKLPPVIPLAESGRASQVAALAFRGKVNLYWASWNKFGWPELEGFTPSLEEAEKAYKAAADDFESVIDDYGLTLFRNGEPGEPGEAGKCEKLPNYFYLFTPDYDCPATNPEIIFAFAYSGPNLAQGSQLMNDLGNRSTENSQSYLCPTLDLVNLYQLVSTGDYAPDLIPMNGNDPAARTTENSALNPASYEGRDYRCRSTVLWDYESMMSLVAFKEAGPATWVYKQSAPYIQASAMETGFVLRKWIRDKSLACSRSDTPQDYYLMRLADVYLMYAEATNFLDGPQPKAIDLVNKIRARGALPALAAEKTDTEDAFFKAIEQERKVEFVMEGQRYFDIRRWRKFEEVWGPVGSPGRTIRNTWNEPRRNDFVNYSQLNMDRYYILQIPQGERDLNPNLTQNKPWL